MTSLAIDATHTYASLTKPFFSFSLDNSSEERRVG